MYCNSWYHIHSSFYHTGTVLFYLILKYSYPMNMYIMILSIMYYFTNFGDLCDSGSFYLYGFPESTTQYDKKFILLLLTSFISEIKYSYSCHWHPFSPIIDPHTVLRPTTQWSCATNSTTSPPLFSTQSQAETAHLQK